MIRLIIILLLLTSCAPRKRNMGIEEINEQIEKRKKNNFGSKFNYRYEDTKILFRYNNCSI